MSSLGSQWRVIRHYLSLTNLNAEVEKLVQKIKPATPEQWDQLIKKIENVVSAKLKETEQTTTKHVANATTVEGTETKLANNEKSEKADQKVSQEALTVGSEAKEITFEGFLQGLKLKKDLHFGKISDSSWKNNKPIVTKTSIHSRTAYVISALVTAETAECRRKRAEHFIDHLHQYPEARDYAIKEGAVRALLRVRSKLNDDTPATKEIDGMVNEALALVGYSGAPGGRGPRVLALDGGGIRGIIAIELLRTLERLAGRKVHQLFDYIVGVSTGAIIAAVIGGGVGTLDTANEMYLTLSKQMFGNTSLIGGTSRLVWTHSYYDTAAWERLLRDNLGDCTLTQCNRHNSPKMALVSCVVNSGARLSPFLFRSYECGFRVRSVFPGTARARLWHAVRASAAAPTYFDEFRLDGLLHQDGGIMVNNPTGVGLHEAKLLFGPDALRRATVVSIGTGRPLHKPVDYQLLAAPQATSWRDKFNKILDSATDTEGVHLVLNDLLPGGNYFRFNPPLMSPCAMDEVDDGRLQDMLRDARAYTRRNQHKFQQAAERLTAKRSVAQRVADYASHQALLMGVTPGY
ncbi:calcium-independent phospholipase A2-gamma-like [Ostrinia nubilalis]|uniref:calcium-independent phospholipase A2-gamma-like n=1 Tax=Ostrinia nubilalis TaxID=29057 RepID=UPI0030822417